MNRTSKVVIAAAVSAMMIPASYTMADQTVKQEDLPEAVRATLQQKQTPGSTIIEIELEKENGQDVYSIELKVGAEEREILIAPDGKFIGEEKEDDDDADDKRHDEKEDDDEKPVELSQLPAPAQAKVKELTANATVKELTREIKGIAELFEVEFEKEGQQQSVKLAADGSILEIERQLNGDQLSAAIKSEIQKKYPAGTIKKAETVETHHLEVEITDGGKEYEIKLSPAGTILKVEAEDEDEDED